MELAPGLYACLINWRYLYTRNIRCPVTWLRLSSIRWVNFAMTGLIYCNCTLIGYKMTLSGKAVGGHESIKSVLKDVQSHYQVDLSLAVIKSTHLILAAAVGVYLVNTLRCHFKVLISKHWNDHISAICQWISINEVSKCAEINCSSFDNLHFPLEDVKIDIQSAHSLYVYVLNEHQTQDKWINFYIDLFMFMINGW